MSEVVISVFIQNIMNESLNNKIKKIKNKIFDTKLDYN